MDAELNKMVVTTVHGKPVTRGELHAAFSAVQDKHNWKNPIDAKVFLSFANEDYEKALIREAVIFFTGTVPTFRKMKNSREFRVKAAGYYCSGAE